LLTYEELTADPLKAILAFFRYIKLPVGPERISRGIAQAIRNRATYNTRFAPPEVMSHRYAKHPVLANFEDIVIRTCRGYHQSCDSIHEDRSTTVDCVVKFDHHHIYHIYFGHFGHQAITKADKETSATSSASTCTKVRRSFAGICRATNPLTRCDCPE
jgi:ribonuclease HII